MTPIIEISHGDRTGGIATKLNRIHGAVLTFVRLKDKGLKTGEQFDISDVEKELSYIIFKDKSSIKTTINLLNFLLENFDEMQEGEDE
jgi:hypothetical protein